MLRTRTRKRPYPAWSAFLAGLAAAILATAGKSSAQQRPPAPFGDLRQCEGIQDQTRRLNCLQSLTAQPDATAKSSTINIGTWRLVRTPNPAGGADAVSIMQTADFARSDLDFAGLMLRCGENSIETTVVLVRPFPPRAHPKVTVTAGGKSNVLTATVVPPGAALLLPPEATLLAAGAWQSAIELGVEIDDESPIRGIVSLKNLGPAYRLLMTSCRS